MFRNVRRGRRKGGWREGTKDKGGKRAGREGDKKEGGRGGGIEGKATTVGKEGTKGVIKKGGVKRQ